MITNISCEERTTGRIKPATFKLHQGDATEIVGILPEVNTIVTSPPYYRKRSYGEAPNEIGRERDPEAYLDNLVYLFNAVNLHPHGSAWINLGDKRGKNGLMLLPERFALKMIECGWKLIDRVIWAKNVDLEDGTSEGNCMVEPAKNRLNGNAYEHLYHFVKCAPRNSWCDVCAVRLPRAGVKDTRYLPRSLMEVNSSTEGRCLHDVWLIPIRGSKLNHYATFPLALCERPIAMSCPLRVCTECGHLRSRIVSDILYDEGKRSSRRIGKYSLDQGKELMEKSGRHDAGRSYAAKKPLTTGWTRCGHNSWAPGLVLDPFSGSGTTGEVALKLGRSFIGIDLYRTNVEMARRRCVAVAQQIGDLDIGSLER